MMQSREKIALTATARHNWLTSHQQYASKDVDGSTKDFFVSLRTSIDLALNLRKDKRELESSFQKKTEVTNGQSQIVAKHSGSAKRWSSTPIGKFRFPFAVNSKVSNKEKVQPSTRVRVAEQKAWTQVQGESCLPDHNTARSTNVAIPTMALPTTNLTAAEAEVRSSEKIETLIQTWADKAGNCSCSKTAFSQRHTERISESFCFGIRSMQEHQWVAHIPELEPLKFDDSLHAESRDGTCSLPF